MVNVYSVDSDIIELVCQLSANKPRLNSLFGNMVFLDTYSLYILVAHTKNNLLNHLDPEQFDLLYEYMDNLYFVCKINKDTKKWCVDYVIYDISHKKAFLIKKVILKALKPIFNNITFNKNLSEAKKITIYDIVI